VKPLPGAARSIPRRAAAITQRRRDAKKTYLSTDFTDYFKNQAEG